MASAEEQKVTPVRCIGEAAMGLRKYFSWMCTSPLAAGDLEMSQNTVIKHLSESSAG
jgi:hypothetical protein